MDFFVLESFTICSTCRQRKSRKKSSSTCNIVASLKHMHRVQAFFFFLGALNCDDEPGNILIGWKCHLGWMLLGSNTITFGGWDGNLWALLFVDILVLQQVPGHTETILSIANVCGIHLKTWLPSNTMTKCLCFTCLDVRMVKEEMQL